MEETSRARLVNVWHIGAWNRNVGDWALAYQLHRLLNEQGRPRDVTFKFYMVDSQRTYFHQALVDQMNEEADLILVGGGGLIFFRPEDKSISGWSFNIEPEKVCALKKPLIVYAIGYNRFAYDETEFPPATAQHLRITQAKAALFSVRNNGTRRTLIERYGLDPNKIDVVPDPGICLYDRPIEIRPKRNAAPFIAVNWAADRPHQRYPKPSEENAKYFLISLKTALVQSVKDLGTQILFLPHLMQIDTDIFEYFASGFPKGSIFSLHHELPYIYAPPGEMLYAHVPFFTNVFRQADVLIGMRLHNCVLGFGAGKPFITLGSHPKLGFFAEDTGLMKYKIPLVDPNEETPERMYATIAACLKDEAYKEQVRSALCSELQKLRSFNERLLDLVS